MFNIGPEKLLLIGLVALILLGPDKLPENARRIGNLVAEIRRMSVRVENEMRSALTTPTDTLRALVLDPAPSSEPDPPGAHAPQDHPRRPATDQDTGGPTDPTGTA